MKKKLPYFWPSGNILKGKVSEFLALLFLLLRGLHPVLHGYKGKYAEVDLVAVKGKTLHLVEVKYRKKRHQAHTAIHPQQQKRLQKEMTVLHKKYKRIENGQVDVILFYMHWPFIEYIENVWEFKG